MSFTVLISFISGTDSHGQRLPATVNTTVTAPYSVYLNDYFEIGSNKLAANIIFNDYNEPSWDVRLRITIESNRLKIETKPEFTPVRPLTIIPGVPVQLTGGELTEYFNFNNLVFSGISSAALRQNARLPEGMYSFCFEVLDYRTGKVLSTKSCATAWLILQDPPKIINPMCDTYVSPSIPQNILFQWQLSNAMSPNTGMGPQFKLHLYEVTDPSTAPRSAIANGKSLKIFESEIVSQTNFLYDIAAPTLDIGKMYLYQVQAIDPDGKDLYKNQGLSEVCWFYYGYPTGGNIALQSPLNKSAFSKSDPVNFKWTAPDKRIPGQPFSYHLKVVKVDEGQDPELAIANGQAWYESITSPIQGTYGFGFQLKTPLDPMTDYAWQVVCMSDEQEVAQSSVFTFRGPGIIERFNAGMHIVEVISTKNRDFTKLCGTGKVRVGETDTVDVQYENLHIKEVADGRYVLRSGEIFYDFEAVDTIRLNPDYLKNGNATFFAHKLRLNRAELALEGVVKWTLPHPVVSNNLAHVVADTSWINFDKFKLNGNASFAANNNFELLDPYKFRLEMDTLSDFVIKNNKYFLRLRGEVILPETVKGSSGSRISVPFTKATQLFYIENSKVDLENNVVLVKNSGLTMEPKSFVIDFSEDQSPGKLVNESSWKGVYFDKFSLSYKTSIDESDQLVLQQELVHQKSLETTNEYRSWVGSRGLDFFITEDFDKNVLARFNEFPSKLHKLRLEVVNNNITESYFKGGILVPFIDTLRQFSYTIPLSDYGFREGYLDDLDGTTFTFNKGAGDQEVNIKILRAVFAERSRLDMALDLEWPSMDVHLKSVNGFRVWGNHNIGFGQPNGALALNKQVNAKVSGFPITIDGIGAGSSSGMYSFGTTGKVVMADDVSGNTGPPEANVYTIVANPYADKESIPVVVAPVNSTRERTPVPIPSFNANEITENSNQIVEEANDEKSQLSVSSGEEKTYSNMEIGLVPAEEMDPGIAELFNLYNDFNQRQKAYLDSVMLVLSDPITFLINREADKLNMKIIKKIEALTDSLNGKIAVPIGFVVDNLRDRTLSMVSTENTSVYGQINAASERIKLNITGQVQTAVKASVHENVTLPLTIYIKDELAKNAAVYIKNEMVSVGVDVKNGEAHAKIEGNVGKKLEGLAKVIFDQKIDFRKIVSNVSALGNGIFDKIDTKNILDQLAGEIAVIVAKAAIQAAAGETIDNLSENLGVSVPMNFVALGDKLRKGDIKGALTLDPVAIRVNTNFVSFNGLVKYTPDDPTYGTVWRGDIDFTVKVPKTFALDGIYINGRKDSSSYWFCQIAPPDGKAPAGGAIPRTAKPLQNPVPLGPVQLVAAVGRVYHHMRDDGRSVVPDPAMKYGAFMNFVFFDSNQNGKTLRLDVTAGIEMQQNGDYLVEFLGDMQGGNKKPLYDKVDPDALALGTLSLKYNSAEEHFIGYGAASIESRPILCASGSILVDVKPSAWRLAIGSRDERLVFVPGCAGWSPTGWLDINQNTAELGLGMMYSMEAGVSFNIGVVGLGIRVEAGVAVGVVAVVQYNPSLVLNEAGVWVDIYGRVIVDYSLPLKKGSITLVDLYCQGDLLVKFNPKPSTLSGSVRGYVRLLGIVECKFNAGFEKNM